MKLKQGFEIMEIAGDYMVIPTGSNMASFGGSMVVNEVSAFLLEAMKNDISEEELLEKMLNEYAVDRDTAARDLAEVLHTFEDLGLIER